ncbi:MAG TPA: outer membrane protein assembly factor BamA [Vicinamibacterales bacterium]|nr:outer membrane protein assembly factor BamA [Vicinamibacterales bacterium]
MQTPAAPQAAPSPAATVCGQPVAAPQNLPPANSGPVVFQVVLCFEKQGGYPVVEANTYLYYIEMKSRVSNSQQNRWVPYDDAVEQVAREDFKRLWATNFLDDLAIRVEDFRFSNGVIGKMIVYDMEERERVKIVDYEGLKKVDQSKIEEKLKEKNIVIRLDSFIDPGKIRSVTGVVRELYAAEGYQFAEVQPEVKPVEGGPKLVHVTFHVTEGPKVRIKDIDFIGNKEISDGSLSRKMKENKEKGFFGFITGGGTYKEDKFAEDAQLITDHYRDEGYIMAQVGQPQMRTLEDSKDGRTRWIQLQVPITEGKKYAVGNFDFEGNKVVTSEGLRPLFKLAKGEIYSQKKVKKGLEKAQEVYGSGGYFEFTAYPDLKPRDQPADGDGATGPPTPAGPPAPEASTAQAAKSGEKETPIVDVTMRVDEGKQYFINRITFSGNTTTRDNVIRRELRILEAGVFNTQALKDSVKRINQLGYFKPLEGEAVDVQKTPNADNKVDIGLKFEEQNRNQLTFGAGVSQFDGFFGQLSFQTSNFLGRGETFTVTAQQGNRAKNYQLAFTEPFLFDRPMTAGIDLFAREIRYEGQFTQASAGGNLVFGFQVANYSRMFVNYSYEKVKVKDLNPLYQDPLVLAGNPFLYDSLLIGEGGQRTISKIGPSFVYNTVDHPIFPTSGKRYTLSLDLAGIGGNTNFWNPRAEGIWYFPIGARRRTSLGFRAQAEYISPYGSTVELPIFEKLFLGGEYSMRGFDLRTVGPRDQATGLVVGGNKSLLFNAEYLITIAGPVRLVLFYDVGQVRDRGESFGWKEPVTQTTLPGALIPYSNDLYQVLNPFSTEFDPLTSVIGERSAFKSSTGAEIRFFMPVLNVPFRLIFAANPSRGGVLDNNLQPEKKWKFRFAVGSTF